MPTLAQLLVLKADINADPAQAFVDFRADTASAAKAATVAAVYNADAVPDFWLYRSFIKESDIYETVTADTTWNWATFISLAKAEREAWLQLVGTRSGLCPYMSATLAAIAAIFSASEPLKAHLLVVCRRRASRFERLFATGTGSPESPGWLVLEGPLAGSDCQGALWN